MSEIWRLAARRSKQFDAAAVSYDTYRPRYPEELFDDIVELGQLQRGARALEIGAGTGIGTVPLVSRGLQVTAIEPASSMMELAEEKLGDKARFVAGRFEDWSPTEGVEVIVSFSAWHWVEPGKGLDLAADLLSPGGSLAVAWTEVVSWGESGFEERLAEVTGSPWPKKVEHMMASLGPISADPRFGDFAVRHHRFERVLDAASFIALTRTYPGFHSAKRDEQFRHTIDDKFGGTVTRVEDAVLHLTRRR
jgi:SAM-dependent methyltransferase